MENRKFRLGITHGDINGVGYEVIFKTFADAEMLNECVPIVYGSPKVATYHRKALGIEANFSIINNASEGQSGRLNVLPCFDEDVKIDLGRATPEAGHAAFLSLERAVKDYKEGLIDAIVTAPINKKSIQSEQFPFVGHTEYFEECIGEGKKSLMILFNSVLRVALVTTHLPIRQVAQAITSELVEEKIKVFNDSLKTDFRLSAPRIAVLSLNPHAGDDGLLGSEEKEQIIPAIENMNAQGVACFGPYPADGFFGTADYQHFDGVLAMYHDQGLAPMKALSMDDGVNFTAGLPLVRTSPDHGTAYNIAGKNVANPNSFRCAVYSAIDICRNRAMAAEASENPLPYRQKSNDKERDGRRDIH